MWNNWTILNNYIENPCWHVCLCALVHFLWNDILSGILFHSFCHVEFISSISHLSAASSSSDGNRTMADCWAVIFQHKAVFVSDPSLLFASILFRPFFHTARFWTLLWRDLKRFSTLKRNGCNQNIHLKQILVVLLPNPRLLWPLFRCFIFRNNKSPEPH